MKLGAARRDDAEHAPELVSEARRGTRWVETTLLIVGILGLLAILREVGAGDVLESLRRLSWTFPLVVLFPGLAMQTIEAWAWRFAFRRDVVPIGELFLVRLAGEALNMTTPTANVGGEGVKAWLLRDRVRLRELVPSLVVSKTSDALAQGLLLALGVVLAWRTPQLDPRMFHGMLFLLAVETLAIGAFVTLQTNGGVAGGASLLGRLGLLRGSSPRAATLHVDRTLAAYYRRRRGRFALSTSCNLVAALLSVIETLIFARALSAPVGFAPMIVANAVASAITFVGFIVPGQVAVREGAYVAAFVALGLDPAVGLAVGLAKRITDLAWIGLGFAALARYRQRPDRARDIARQEGIGA